MRVLRSTDGEDVAVRAAAVLGALISAAIGERGRCALAVSGGTTPGKMFAQLARLDAPWDLVEVFQVDERVAPPGDADRNLTDLERQLLARIPIPPANLHAMGVNDDDLARAATDYGATLERVCGGVLDVVHLGLGDDGHTASWPPGDPVAGVTDADVAIVGPYRDRVRMTLTPPVVNRARSVLWVVSGPEKAPAVAKLRGRDGSIPAAVVDQQRSLLVADQAALGA